MEERMYAVMRLMTDVEVNNPLTGKIEKSKVEGIRGYIPVFRSIKEAEENSQNGKYKVIEIIEPKREDV